MAGPNFIVIGAKKSGTTSLYRYLDLHPEIAMAYPRELNFFVPGGARSANHAAPSDQSPEWYLSRFDAPAPVHGESSPNYASFPLITGVPKRIRALVPDVSLIYLVRDPIERMLSEYGQRWGHNGVRRPVSEVFSDPELVDTTYVVRGRYQMQIEQFLEHFEENRLLIVAQEDLRNNRQATLDRIFAFVGVKSFSTPKFDKEHNIARDRRRSARLAGVSRRWGEHNPVRTLFRTGKVKDLLSRPMPRHELEPEVRARVAEYFHEDARRLRAFTGQRFESWSV
ncbi:MAG: sulfotransferase family protein [Thermoleophilaceae bacterium]